MPIRFRCAECNQLLGIARRKSGSIIACPTCSFEQIVPDPDEPSHVGQQIDPMSLLEKSDFEEILGQPVERGNRRAGAAAPGVVTATRDTVNRPSGTGSVLHQQVNPATGSAVASPRVDLSRLTGDRNRLVYLSPVSPFLIGTIVAVVLAFLLGIVVGKSLQTDTRPMVKKKTDPEPVAPAVENKQPEKPAAAIQNPQNKFLIAGEVTYLATPPNGEPAKPDIGTTVIAFPKELAPQKGKLVIDGLKPLPIRPDNANGGMVKVAKMEDGIGTRQIRECGGNVGVVQHNGNFEVAVDAPGVYCILVLSANREREFKAKQSDTEFFKKYFSTPKEMIIGSLDFKVIETQKVEENSSDPINIVFGG